MKVLIVDDEPEARAGIALLLDGNLDLKSEPLLDQVVNYSNPF